MHKPCLKPKGGNSIGQFNPQSYNFVAILSNIILFSKMIDLVKYIISPQLTFSVLIKHPITKNIIIIRNLTLFNFLLLILFDIII